MDVKIFRINYKSDFILTLNSDAGWMTPFCIKFWTGAPSQAYFVGWDGETYTHCAYDPSEPTKLLVQFDDHHLPIGDLKFQIAYHFTVADFPDDTEDEVINPASITVEIDGDQYQVMLDFTGETAPEIAFSLPAYANEAQRIANEQQRIIAEEQRIANEQARISAETIRQQNEQQRIDQETARVNEFATLKSQSQAATRDANAAATLANEKAQLAADKAALADDAATLAIQKAQLAADKAALANDAAQLAADKAALAQQKAEYAQQQGGYAKDQGDYAKNQGNYAKEQGEIAQADHERAEADHGIAVDDHTQAGNDHTRAESDHGIAVNDHTQAGNDHTRAESDHGIAADDHTQAGNDHTRAESDHGIAADDHTQAGNDHTRAESDHTRAESDHAAVEVYVDSLGAFDISAYHATGGVLAKYADLTAALGTNGANIPEALRKGGMSVKFVHSSVHSSDNKYVQSRCKAQSFSIDPSDWVNVEDKLEEGLEAEAEARQQAINEQNLEIAEFEETITNQINNYRPIEIEGNVENAPDEEDLTSINQSGTDVLKFKNRNNLNGMGYIILRRNASFESQLTQTNTIYEIRYDFDLDGDEVTIPANCVLEFDGGSLRNGTINWNNTLVDGNVNLQNITIGTGKLSNDIVYVDWFNPYGDGEHDDSYVLIQVIKSIKQFGATLIFGNNKTYLHGDGLDKADGTGRQYEHLQFYNQITWEPVEGKYSPDLGWFNVYNNHFSTSETPSSVDLGRDIRLMFEEMSNITIEGNGSSIVSNESNGITKNNSILWLYKCSNVVVKNLKIDGKKNERFNKLGVLYSDYNSGLGYLEWHNIRVVGCSNITFDNVVSDNSCHNAFDVKYDYSDGSENKNISFVNCNVDNAYKNGIGCNSCDGFVIQGGKYGNCGATYGTAPKANIDLEPEATKFINNILITNATFYWDLDKDLNVEGEVVVNTGTKNTEIAGCDFINAGLTIVGSQNAKKSATAVSVKGCSFLNSIIWNRGDASTIESCSIVYDSEFIVYNGENVNHSQITPINNGPNTQFISNIVNWSSDLSTYTGYMSLSGVVNNNTFNNLCGSGNYIFRTYANQLNNNTFTDAGVDGKNGTLYGDYTPIAAGQNNIGKGILQYAQSIGLMTGPDYIGTAKAYLTRTLLLSSTDVAIQFPYLANNEVATIKVGMREKINNVNTNTFIIYNSKNKEISLGYETLTNDISNLVLKQGTAGIILDFSNVTFVSSRYVWISVEKDYVYPSFSNYNIYNVLDSAQLNELIQAGSYSRIYNCKTVGETASRPPSSRLLTGFQFFDTTLGKPIYWNGTAWVDATGATV